MVGYSQLHSKGNTVDTAAVSRFPWRTTASEYRSSLPNVNCPLAGPRPESLRMLPELKPVTGQGAHSCKPAKQLFAQSFHVCVA